jgi:hypothetical protein
VTARCEGAPQIYADDVVPFFLGHVRQHPVPQDSGVVDQHVQAPEELHRLVHHLLRGGKGADIRPVDNCLATLLLDLVDVARAAYDVDRLPDDVAVAIAAAEIDQLAFRLTQRRASEMGRAGQLDRTHRSSNTPGPSSPSAAETSRNPFAARRVSDGKATGLARRTCAPHANGCAPSACQSKAGPRKSSSTSSQNASSVSRPELPRVGVNIQMKYVIYELVGGWARVTLNRPEKRNALSAALLDELASVLWEADEDREVHAVLLRGAGPSFCSGYDLGRDRREDLRIREGASKFRGISSTDDDIWQIERNQRAMMTIFDMHKPVVAQVHGYCLAGGIDLAMLCDLVIAADDARIGFPPARSMGTLPVNMWPRYRRRHRRGPALVGPPPDRRRATRRCCGGGGRCSW